MTAVVTVVFTSCPTRGGQQRNQFRSFRPALFISGKLRYLVEFTLNLLSKGDKIMYLIELMQLKGYCTIFQHALKLLELTSNNLI